MCTLIDNEPLQPHIGCCSKNKQKKKQLKNESYIFRMPIYYIGLRYYCVEWNESLNSSKKKLMKTTCCCGFVATITNLSWLTKRSGTVAFVKFICKLEFIRHMWAKWTTVNISNHSKHFKINPSPYFLSLHLQYNYHGVDQVTASNDFRRVHHVAEGLARCNLHGQLQRTRYKR